jgi:galactose mutarotase-like enzyme
MADEVFLTAESLSAVIQPFGAELFSLKDSSGRELLWGGDPTIWAGRAPLLFPIVGALSNDTYHLSGQDYHLPRHGFARRKLFSVTQMTRSSAKFQLGWDEATMQVYPFHFELEVGFSVEERSLTVSVTITNLGSSVMPASF